MRRGVPKDKAKGDDNHKLLTELMEGQKQLQSAVELLVKQQTNMSTQLQEVANSLQSLSVSDLNRDKGTAVIKHVFFVI